MKTFVADSLRAGAADLWILPANEHVQLTVPCYVEGQDGLGHAINTRYSRRMAEAIAG